MEVILSAFIEFFKKFFNSIKRFFSKKISMKYKSDISVKAMFFEENFIYFRIVIPNPLEVPLLITKGQVLVRDTEIEIGHRKEVVRYFWKIDGYPENKTIYSDEFPVRIEPSDFAELTLVGKSIEDENFFLSQKVKIILKTNRGKITKKLTLPEKSEFSRV